MESLFPNRRFPVRQRDAIPVRYLLLAIRKMNIEEFLRTKPVDCSALFLENVKISAIIRRLAKPKRYSATD